jgi:hypothetical protein
MLFRHSHCGVSNWKLLDAHLKVVLKKNSNLNSPRIVLINYQKYAGGNKLSYYSLDDTSETDIAWYEKLSPQNHESTEEAGFMNNCFLRKLFGDKEASFRLAQ